MNKTTLLITAGVIVALIGLLGSTGHYSGVRTGPDSAPAEVIALSPHEVVLASVQAAQDGDLASLAHTLFSSGELAEFEAKWNSERTREVDPSDELVFQVTMESMVADGAEDVLMAKITPRLDELRPQTAMIAGMLSSVAQMQLDSAAGINTEKAEKASRVLSEFTKLLAEGDFASPEKARTAIEIICRAARALELTTLSELHALEFDQLLARGDVVLAATKRVLSVYGLSVDAWLDSVRAETVRETGDRAWVRVSVDLLGLSEDTELELQRVDGRWTPVRSTPVASNGGI